MKLKELKKMLENLSEEELQQPLILLGYGPGMVATGKAKVSSEPIHCRRWDFPYLDLQLKSTIIEEWKVEVDQEELDDNISWLEKQQPVIENNGFYIEMIPHKNTEWPRGLYNL